MALTLNAKSYVADGWDTNSVRFQGPAHSTSVLDRLLQKITPAKPTALFSGLARFQVKLTRTHSLTGAKTATGNSTVDINIARPVGISDADSDALVTDLGTYIASAAFKTALKTSQPNG
jgi:hypothetical protein